MKTEIISLIGDHKENFYLLGKKEAHAFKELEKSAIKILSSNPILRYGQEILTRTKYYTKKDDKTFFDECIVAYAEGLGIDPVRYYTFMSIFESAAHYGQIYPELKSFIPGCCSVFEKHQGDYLSNRLIDFPLTSIFNEYSRIYYFKFVNQPTLLNYSCAGMAPLILHALHDSGFSASLHYKPSTQFHKDGESIFKIFFDNLTSSPSMQEFRREIRKKISQTKWGFYLLDQTGQVISIDIDGPSMNQESFNLNETSPLVFTNIPIQKDLNGLVSQTKYSEQREKWFSDRYKKKKNMHTLDVLTQVATEDAGKWTLPMVSLSTVGALQINLNKGKIHLKEGKSSLTKSDPIYEINLVDLETKLLRPSDEQKQFEDAWKRASKAQGHYDQGDLAKAFHELQMSMALSTHTDLKKILSFYFHVWEFKTISNRDELLMIYREMKKLNLPAHFKDQYLFMIMRFEKKLKLKLSVDQSEISASQQSFFIKERDSNDAIFRTWMKFIYPRLDLFEIFSPHHS